MAEQLPKGSRWKVNTPGKPANYFVKYPWHEWLNGRIWILTKGVDFDWPSTAQFRHYILVYCKNKGIKVQTRVSKDGKKIYLKSLSPPYTYGMYSTKRYQMLVKRYEQLYGPYHEDFDLVDFFEQEDANEEGEIEDYENNTSSEEH